MYYLRTWGRESYRNRPRGIEQTIQVARGASVEMAVRGLPIPQKTAHRVTFGTVLTYGELHARDAASQAVEIQLVATDGKVRLELSAQTAAFPVTIQALVSAATWDIEGNQELAALGYSVACAGDVNGETPGYRYRASAFLRRASRSSQNFR